MTASNPWFWLALLATVGLYKLEFFSTLLNLKALSATVPPRLRGWVTEEEHERALEYARVNARTGLWESGVRMGVLVAFWWGGGFTWVDGWVRSWGAGEVVTGLGILGLAVGAQMVLGLPFEVYQTFRTEAEFGFNRTSGLTFVADRLKSVVLLTVLGGPLAGLLVWWFAREPLAALYGWLAVSGFSLVMTLVAPRVVLPLFYKFQPLGDEGLRGAILEMAGRLGFPVGDVCVVDGSRRSAKANAFFTGMGRLKRIALYDTLLANHGREEVLAVLAHEIGHGKRGHVPRQVALHVGMSGVMFALLHVAVQDPRLQGAFGVAGGSVAWSLVFFGVVYQPVGVVLGALGGWLSRRHEFEADAFAREAMGGPGPMAGALARLSRDQLSNPTPHPFYVFLNYSHPTVLQRLEALEGGTGAGVEKAGAMGGGFHDGCSHKNFS